MLFRARAPLRVSFAGGGTDVSPYPEEHGGAVLNAAIGKYAYASLSLREDNVYRLCNLDDGVEITGDLEGSIEHDGGLSIAAAVIRKLRIKQGFDLTIHSDAVWGSGLGSSSTHLVAVLGVFARWLRIPLSLYEVAELSYEVERQDLQQEGGRQDQYSAAFGGFNFMEFQRDGVVVHPLRIKEDVLDELQYRSLLCFVGRTRRSSEILHDQIARYRSGNEQSVEALHQTKALAFEMRTALLRGQIDYVGELLHEGWLLKRQFSSLISNSEIDDIYEEARQHGAVGGKLLGAGGGGHMLFLCSEDERPRLAIRLAKRGVNPVPFSFEPRGLTSWNVTNAW